MKSRVRTAVSDRRTRVAETVTLADFHMPAPVVPNEGRHAEKRRHGWHSAPPLRCCHSSCSKIAITAPAVPLRLVRSPLLPHATSAHRASVVMYRRMVLSRCKRDKTIRPHITAEALWAEVGVREQRRPNEAKRSCWRSYCHFPARTVTAAERRGGGPAVTPFLA